MTAAYTKDEILSQLDACAEDYTFPMLDNGYVYLADVRLSAYRDDSRWALVIERIGYNQRAGGNDDADNCLYCFGNCLTRPPGTANEDFLPLLEDGPERPTFDDEHALYVRGDVKTIRLRNETVPLHLTQESLTRKGIELEEPPRITGAELMRSLALDYRKLLLATEDELRSRIPADLPLILRLDEWHHPDLSGGEVPGESETFGMIAEALVSGEASVYRPSKSPNTHWKNWPEGGRL